MIQLSHLYLIKKIKQFLGEGILYLTNHVVNHIPLHFVRLCFYRIFLQFDIGSGSAIFMETWFD